MTLLQSGLAKSLAEDYTIDQSLRFDEATDPVLSRTPTVAGNRKTYTVSAWVKRGKLELSYPAIFLAGVSNTDMMRFTNTDQFGYRATTDREVKSTAVFRDPAAWYHCVMAVDTTQSVAADRVKLYINGDEITDFATADYPVEDYEGTINNTVIHFVGTGDTATSRNYDGYIAELYVIDGTALTPSSFGETDSTTNQWKPIDASGLTFGTNGFYQKYGTTTANTTFTDVSSYGHTITANGGMVNSAAQVKYGSSSALFGGDGSGDYLEIADSSAFDLGTGDFTLEAWVYPTSDGSYRKIFVSGGWGVGPTGEYDYIIDKTDGGALRIQLYDDTSAPYVSTTGTMTIDAWNHVAAVRSGTTVSLYIDGTASGTMTTSYSLISHGNPQIGIQTDVSATTQMWDGYIAGVRISNSARYTGNFTPSTGPYTSDANTMFLLDTWDGGLGEDSSGNTNTFAVTNLVATDQMPDTPTNNWCTLNPVAKASSSASYTPNLEEGNLKALRAAAGWLGGRSTFAVPKTGKFYAEFYVGGTTDGSHNDVLGLMPNSAFSYTDTGVYAWFSQDGQIRYSNVDLTTTTAPDTGDIKSIYVNDGEVKLYLNNSLVYTSPTNLSAVDQDYFFYTQSTGDGHYSTANFGQDSSFAGVLTAQNNDDDGDATADWYYAPPSGVEALCTTNLDDPSIKLPGDNFNTVLWTGDASATRSITGLGFQADMMWSKNRSGSHNHNLVDTVRGVDDRLIMPSSSDAEDTSAAQGYFQSLDSDGWTMIYGGATGWNVNKSGYDYVGWAWKGGGSAVLNEDGTNIDSQVSANTTAGFSICTYTGTGTNDDSFGHGLAEAPTLVIVKRREAASWQVGSTYIQASDDWTHYLELDTTGASDDSDIRWNDTAASASVVTLGTTTNVNGSGGTYVAYCFHSVEGYSKVGTYEGNGDADGTFVYLGFQPAYCIFKAIDEVNGWFIWDSITNPANVMTKYLTANVSDAEGTYIGIDFLSNGLKFRSSSDSDGFNKDTINYIYMAFAESPFKYSNAR